MLKAPPVPPVISASLEISDPESGRPSLGDHQVSCVALQENDKDHDFSNVIPDDPYGGPSGNKNIPDLPNDDPHLKSVTGETGSAINTFQNNLSVSHLDPVDPENQKKGVYTLPRLFMGVNRWILLTVVLIYCLIGGPSYFNWSPFSDMLYQSNAFEWECTQAEVDAALQAGVLSSQPKCDKQEMQVSTLFTICSATHFPVSLLAGILLDQVGPKFTACGGVTTMVLGWIMFALGGRGAAAGLYKAGCVFFAGAIDMVFFPCLCVANLFPGRASTVIALMGTFRSLAFVVPVVLRAFLIDLPIGSFRNLCLSYAGIIVVLGYAVALLLLPVKAFPRVDHKQTLRQDDQELAAARGDDSEGQIRSGCPDGSSTAVLTCPNEQKSAAGGGFVARLRAGDPRYSVLLEMASPLYLALVPFFLFVMFNMIFYIPSAQRLLPDAYDAHRYIQIFSFLPCTPIGWLADLIGIVPVMQLLNGCGLLAFVMVLIPRIPAYAPLQYASSILVAFQTSFLVSQLYCFGAVHFSEKNMGTMIGALCAGAGVFTLLTNMARQSAINNGYGPMCGVCIGLAVANVGALQIVSYLQHKKAKKAKPKLSQV